MADKAQPSTTRPRGLRDESSKRAIQDGCKRASRGLQLNHPKGVRSAAAPPTSEATPTRQPAHKARPRSTNYNIAINIGDLQHASGPPPAVSRSPLPTQPPPHASLTSFFLQGQAFSAADSAARPSGPAAGPALKGGTSLIQTCPARRTAEVRLTCLCLGCTRHCPAMQDFIKLNGSRRFHMQGLGFKDITATHTLARPFSPLTRHITCTSSSV